MSNTITPEILEILHRQTPLDQIPHIQSYYLVARFGMPAGLGEATFTFTLASPKKISRRTNIWFHAYIEETGEDVAAAEEYVTDYEGDGGFYYIFQVKVRLASLAARSVGLSIHLPEDTPMNLSLHRTQADYQTLVTVDHILALPEQFTHYRVESGGKAAVSSVEFHPV